MLHSFRCLEVVNGYIQALVERESGESSALVLPMDHMLYKLSPRQRRVMYDYVVEVRECMLYWYGKGHCNILSVAFVMVKVIATSCLCLL